MIVLRAVHRTWLATAFAVYVLRQLLLANLRIAWEVLPLHKPSIRPAIVAVPLEARSDIELLLLSSLISLTPGTTCIHLSEDHSVLFVYTMFLGQPDEFKKFEARLLRVLR